MLSIKLPWPPSVNGYWESRVVVPKRGKAPFVHHYLSERGKRYRLNVQAAVIEGIGRVPVPTEDNVRVSIRATMPDHRTRDADNILKAVFDALTFAGVWRDDSQVRSLQVELGVVDPPGRLDVTIERLHDPQKKLFG